MLTIDFYRRKYCLKVSCEADSIELGDIPDNGDLDREVDSCQVAPLAQNPLFEV